MARHRDRLWLYSTIAIVGCLGTIAIIGAIRPIYQLSAHDGRCRIGLERAVAVPLLICDIIINIFLTFVFVYLLSPLIPRGIPSSNSFKPRFPQWIGKQCDRARKKASVEMHRSNQTLVKRVENMLCKTFIATVLIMLPTGANLGAISVLEGDELAFVSHPPTHAGVPY
jgi:hypothetical protein